MNYSSIDPIITRWASRHRLHLYSACKEEELRAIRISDDKGRVYGIAIDPPDSKGQIIVRAYAWDFKRRHKTYVVTVSGLEHCLDEALAELANWMSG